MNTNKRVLCGKCLRYNKCKLPQKGKVFKMEECKAMKEQK